VELEVELLSRGDCTLATLGDGTGFGTSSVGGGGGAMGGVGGGNVGSFLGGSKWATDATPRTCREQREGVASLVVHVDGALQVLSDRAGSLSIVARAPDRRGDGEDADLHGSISIHLHRVGISGGGCVDDACAGLLVPFGVLCANGLWVLDGGGGSAKALSAIA